MPFDPTELLGDVVGQATKSVVNGISTQLNSALTIGSQGGQGQYLNHMGLKEEYTCFVTCSDLGINFSAALPPDFDWSAEATYDAPFKDVVGSVVSSMGTVGSIANGGMRAMGLSMVTQALTAQFWTGSSTGDITLPLVFQAENDEVEEVLKPLIDLLSLTMPRLAGNQRGSILQAPGPHFDLIRAANNVISAGKGALDAGGGSNTTIAGRLVSTAAGAANSAFNKMTTAIGSKGLVDGVASSVNDAYSAAASYSDTLVKQGVRNQVTLRLGRYIQIPSVIITNVSQKHFVQPVGTEYGVSTGNMQRVEVSVTFKPFMDLTQNDLLEIFLDQRLQEYISNLLSRGPSVFGLSDSSAQPVVGRPRGGA